MADRLELGDAVHWQERLYVLIGRYRNTGDVPWVRAKIRPVLKDDVASDFSNDAEVPYDELVKARKTPKQGEEVQP